MFSDISIFRASSILKKFISSPSVRVSSDIFLSIVATNTYRLMPGSSYSLNRDMSFISKSISSLVSRIIPSLGVSPSSKAPPTNDHLFGASICGKSSLCNKRISFLELMSMIFTFAFPIKCIVARSIYVLLHSF